VATGSETEILPPREYELRSPQFSADGNHVFYGARDGRQETTVYQVPIFGGTSRQIVTNVNHNFTISPDGVWLAFVRYDPGIHGNHLIVCRTDGSDERVVASHKQTTFFRAWGAYPSWSPDGKKIVTSVHRDLGHKAPEERKSYFVEIDLDTGNEKILNAPHWSVALNAFWLPDGSGFIAQVQNGADEYYQLWHLSYPDGLARPLTNDINNYTEFRLAPDASFIIASEEKSPHNLQLISTGDTTQIRHLTSSTTIQRGVLGLDWTPDAKEIVYLQLEGLAAGNIWKMNVETLESSQLTFDKGAWNRYPSVTPDGRSIVFASNRTGKWHIWQMDMDGTGLRQITDGSGENIQQVSPDGKWLAYVTPGEKPNTLWKRPLAGGDPIKVLQDAGGRFAISPDFRQIVSSYYDPDEKNKNPWKYVLLPFDGDGSIEDTGFWSQAAIVRWKPDGTGIYYLSTGQSNTNIWLYSTADKTKRPVTNFDSQEIIDLSVSPDGAH
jgi:Tol biopolymer transport system component